MDKEILLDDLKLSLRIDGDDDDRLLNSYINAAKVYIKTAVGGDDKFWQQEDVIAVQKIAILALAGAYYDYRVALQDVMTYPINLTLNAIISQLRGKLALYEEGELDA